MLFCPNCSCGIKITKENRELLNDVVLKSSKDKEIPVSPATAQISMYAAETEEK